MNVIFLKQPMETKFLKSKIALGTAQLGLNYGIANRKGKIAQSEMRKILKMAIKNNINTIETAESYGNCEKKLGKLKRSKLS